MKAVWQGSIAFGLVNIPIKLYSAAEPKQFSFHLLCGKCKSRLHYKRWCAKCKKEIPWTNVLHGFEIQKGKWKIFTKQELARLKPAKAEQIEILAFSTLEAFDPILFSKHYYVVPSQRKEKAYFLLREVLQASAKAAFGKMIMHEKEHLVFIQAYKNGMLLTTLYYPYEVRDIKKIAELKTPIKVTKIEFELAKKLVQELTKEPRLEEYKDAFEKKLKEMILEKVPKEKPIKPKPEKLVEALKLSVKKR